MTDGPIAGIPHAVLFSTRSRENIQGIIDKLYETGESVGGWTSKYDNRETGFSYHAKFEKKVSVFVTLEFVNQLQNAPAMLVDACRKLLAADALATEFAEVLVLQGCTKTPSDGYRCGTTADGSPETGAVLCPSCKARKLIEARDTQGEPDDG